MSDFDRIVKRPGLTQALNSSSQLPAVEFRMCSIYRGRLVGKYYELELMKTLGQRSWSDNRNS